jgi:hypothetical protein
MPEQDAGGISRNERRTIHLNLSRLDPRKDYTFRHSLSSFPVQRHTAESRARACQELPWLALIPADQLTHYTEAELPGDAIVATRVTVARDIGGQVIDHPVHMAIHVPQRGLQKARRQIMARRAAAGDAPGIHPKLARYGVTRQQFLDLVGDDPSDIPEFPEKVESWQDAVDAAVALLYHHTSMANFNTSDGGSIPGIIVDWITQAVTSTGELPLAICDDPDGWLQTALIGETDVKSTQPSDEVLQASTASLQWALVQIQNDPDLSGEQWHYEYGTSSAGYNGSSNAPDGPGELVRGAPPGASNGGWVPRNLTPSNGLTIDEDSFVYTPPKATTRWTGSNLWSFADQPSLSSDIANAIRAGQIYLQVTSADYPQGLIRGQLVVGETDPDSEMTTITASLSGAEVVPPVQTDAKGTATLTLNAVGTGLTYDVDIDLGSYTGAIDLNLYSGEPAKVGAVLRPLVISALTQEVGTLSFQCTNRWLRHLSLCVQYLDSAGTVLPPQGWSDRIPDWLRGTFEPCSLTPFVALLPPVTTIFGVPVRNIAATTITVPVWNEVHTVRILAGGLGQGSYDPNVCPIGVTITALAELAMPAFLLAAGSADLNTKVVNALFQDQEVLFAACAAGGFLVAGGIATDIGTAQNPAAVATGLAEKFGPMLLSPATSLGKWVLAKISADAAALWVPFLDVGLMVINAAVTAAQLDQTVIEVLDSPFVYETDVARSVDISVTLSPDTTTNAFPPYHEYFTVTVVYDTGTTIPTYTQTLPSTPQSTPIKVVFTDAPAGGSLKVFAAFYAPDGWQSGQANTGWIPALPDADGELVIDKLTITNNKVPLSVSSVYVHNSKMARDKDNALSWQAAVNDPPTATITTLSPYGSQLQLLSWSGLTIAQAPGMAGYAYQATGLALPVDQPDRPVTKDAMWTVRNLSILENPQQALSYPGVGFSAQPGIAYELSSSDDGKGNNFFIEAVGGEFDPQRNPAGGYHVRQLSLQHDGKPPAFTPGGNASYGRFPFAMNRYAYHPQGYVFGIRSGGHKLYRLQLTSAPVQDGQAPMATMAAGEGTRDGLLKGPVAVAAALDGRVLVLEAQNQRIQAFDIYGKPVPYFTDLSDPAGEKIPTCQLVIRPESTYLDLAVEQAGYLYVLSYTQRGDKPVNYQVDLYEPDGKFLVTTPNTAAANITVDIMRSMYMLNYEIILDSSGRPQPSISLWLPPAPPPSQLRAAEGGLA